MIVNVAERCQLGGCFVVCDERLANNQPFVPTSSIVVAGVRLCSEPRLGYNVYAGKCRDSTVRATVCEQASTTMRQIGLKPRISTAFVMKATHSCTIVMILFRCTENGCCVLIVIMILFYTGKD